MSARFPTKRALDMRRLALIPLLSCLLTTTALADAQLLSRLSQNVEAPTVVRPDGQNAVAGVLLQGISGQGGRITTFGHVFRAGDWPQGVDLLAAWNGRSVPLQADVKARHADGSVRHAILSIANPEASEAQIALRTGKASAGGALRVESVLSRGYNLTLDFDFNGQTFSLDAAELMKQALARGEKPWIAGPLASEIRIKRKLTPQLTAIFDIRALADGAVRTSVSMHNDDMFETAGKDIPYGYMLKISGRTMIEQKIVHRRFSNWREIVWAGGEPSTGHVVYDYPYMIAAGAVPAWDPELDINREFFSHASDLEASDTAPMGNALVTKAMPGSGGRADLGMVPDWTLAWLRRQSPRTRYAMMETAEAAGSIPWHIRDPKTTRVPTLDAHPRYWLDARANQANNGHGPMVTDVDGWQLDNAHQPEMAYVPYMISGDRYFLDELIAQTAFALISYDANPGFRDGAAGNLRNDEVRGQAWANRTHGYAAFITPDDHPEKEYLSAKLRERLTWYATEYPRNDKLGGPVSYETAGWIQGATPTGVILNWQVDFFNQSLAQIGRMGFGEANGVYSYARKYHLNRFLRSDFNSLWSTGYRTIHGDRQTGAPFRTWSEIARANIADGRFEPNPQVQSGNGESAWNYAAQARAGYASLLGAFPDPVMAEAYAQLVHNTIEMQTGGGNFSRYPKWGIVPVFPDGSTLPIANHRAVSGEAQSGNRNTLLAGSRSTDTLLGGARNDIIAGFDGDDLVAGGDGYNFLAGGRGQDRIVIEGGYTWAAGGPGADVFFIGRKATGGPAPIGRSQITDFKPGVDRLALPQQLGDPIALLRGARAMRGGTLIPLGPQGSVYLKGVRPADLRADSLASR